MSNILNIVGAGLAGSEAAFQAASRGIKVRLYEMRNAKRKTHAHKTSKCAELVCSNSFRSDDVTNAVGLLHEEMRRCDSLIMKAAKNNMVPAGSALAVDRDAFSEEVESTLQNHPNIEIIREEITSMPQDGNWIIASGPLTSDTLTKSIIDTTGEDQLAFFDAIAPIIYKDSIDFSICWYQSRYDKIGPGGDGKDYINCPLNEEEYNKFLDALIAGEKTEFKEWEKDTPYFNGCLPVEVMAERGRKTLLFGPMKPVGLTDPRSGKRPFAVLQLRQDNKLGTLYNMVGFQTKLKYADQTNVFRMVPGLQNAEFARLGGLHRNTFINSPRLLDNLMRMKKAKHIRFAGQITGVEGYVESAATGLLAGIFAADEMLGLETKTPPKNTALGSLLSHITGGASAESFQPMNINFGLFQPPEGRTTKTQRYEFYSSRALKELDEWIREKNERI
ncbi:MAG: methylenetetrahydrofolate--tRNA-(uracil(54)-C(5))-methyltransferase (FADH(2)-oxidizing) TrmFO [Rickettsiaceae bacterium]|nr:methylenetetrahydrofolate--tRNA-(uracil(54)-C(5))-methyltransferase (FADH(2)-oxidizing) TrmFO [Rickettsiaceae bacterium]